MNHFEPYAGHRIAPLPRSDFTRLLVLLGLAGVLVAGWMTTPEPHARAAVANVETSSAPSATLVRVTLPPVVVVGRREAPAAGSSTRVAQDCAAGVPRT